MAIPHPRDGCEAFPKGFPKAFDPFSKHGFISNEAHSGLGWLFSASLQSSGVPTVQVLILGSLSQSLPGQESTVTRIMGTSTDAELAPCGKLKKFSASFTLP